MRPLSAILVILTFSLGCVTFARAASTVQTPRGATLHVVADFPPGAGPFPTMVLAPGQGYHLALPAIEETAKRLVLQGVAVYRFNWAYFTKDPKAGKPSEKLNDELEDMEAVIKLARTEARVAQNSVVVGGKSLGSLVAWRALMKDKTLRAGLFLTPVCIGSGDHSSVAAAEENYPGLAGERRPLAFISGDRDPICAVADLLRFAAKASGNARVAVVGGDHGFQSKHLGAAEAKAAGDRSIDSVARLSANFVVDSLGGQSK